MGTALFRIDIVYVAEYIFRITVGIFHGYFHNICIFDTFYINRFRINFILIGVYILNKFNDTSLKMEGLAPSVPFVLQRNGHTLV